MQCLQTTDLPLTPRRLSLALQARDWVLAISMDQSVAQELSQRSCTQCGVDTYEGAVVCHACRKPAETCAITGGSQAATFPAHPAMRPGCAVTGDLKLHGCFTAHPAQSPGCAITDGSQAAGPPSKPASRPRCSCRVACMHLLCGLSAALTLVAL